MGSHMLLGWEEGKHIAESLQGVGGRNKTQTSSRESLGIAAAQAGRL